MNRYPSRGSTYRGRLLVSMRIEKHPPAKLGNHGQRRQRYVDDVRFERFGFSRKYDDDDDDRIHCFVVTFLFRLQS